MVKIHKSKMFRLFALLNRGYGNYKRQIVLLSLLGILGGFLEGIGINAIIPLFSFLTGSSNFGSDFISQFIKSGFDLVGIKFSLRYLLVLIFFLFLARAVVLLLNNYIKIKTRRYRR